MKTTVLVIDDDVNLRESLGEILEMEGFECTLAGSAKEGLKIAASKQPTVVIMDIQLPDSSGFQICQTLRKTSRPQILIMMSGRFSSSEEKAQGFGLGADEYVTKPFDPKELTARIRQLLSRMRPA